MTKVLVTSSVFTNIANAIRGRLGVQTTYKPSQMAAAIDSIVLAVLQSKTVTPSASEQTIQPDSGYNGLSTVVVSGDADLVGSNIKKDVSIFGVTGTYDGSGGTITESPFPFSPGEYFGNHMGDTSSTLSCQISCPYGKKVILIVMHRASITLSANGYELIYTNSDKANIISIYQKSYPNETVTITQASQARIAACYFIVDPLVTISSPEIQQMDNTSQVYKYTITARSYPYLAVINNVYAGDSSSSSITPSKSVLPQKGNSGLVGTPRLLAYMSCGDLRDTVWTSDSQISTVDYNDNRLYVFPLDIDGS